MKSLLFCLTKEASFASVLDDGNIPFRCRVPRLLFCYPFNDGFNGPLLDSVAAASSCTVDR